MGPQKQVAWPKNKFGNKKMTKNLQFITIKEKNKKDKRIGREPWKK